MADRTTRSTPPPQWAELPTDCLVHVFRRLDLDELASAAPLVCRGWRRAAADPSLWRALDLRRDHLARFMPWGALAGALARLHGVHRFTLAGFLRLCVARARRHRRRPRPPAATLLVGARPRRRRVPGAAAARTARAPPPPTTRASRHSSRGGAALPTWSSTPSRPPSRPSPRRSRCTAPTSPSSGSPPAPSSPEDAAAMAAASPLRGRLRSLCLDRCYLPRQELLAILAGCGGAAPLREFTARFCVGFDDKDEEVLARGAAIERFDIGGSRLLDEPDGDATNGDDYCDSSYVDVI
ncbi:hypothetical protein OsJ_11847 [Oryza sativa Japonica Group]|uniref:F-box domain-containing protein n=1 Tax=Oryza sativa subsp. japonica TaxID=39947 RepID=A3AKQ3_ORYSJ|nr:hypothetical protein OsJ_11847 [Oryza sativa Japonica Group]